MGDFLSVRLKPYDRSRGHLLRQYTVLGIHFKEKDGWVKVPRSVADRLRDERQPRFGRTPIDMVPCAFDILEPEAAVAVEEEEDRVELVRAKATAPRTIAIPPELVQAVAEVAAPKSEPAPKLAPKSKPAPKLAPKSKPAQKSKPGTLDKPRTRRSSPSKTEKTRAAK